MAQETRKQADSAPPIDLDLTAQTTQGPPKADANRYHIFLIDTGWNGPVSKLVRAHLPLLYEYQAHDMLYLLSPSQSVQVLKHAPEMIGRDPIVLVYDRYAPSDRKKTRYHGFHLSLGRFKNAEQALTRLQEFLKFLLMHRTSVNLAKEVVRELHREGTDGMIRILREASTELL
jgi:hypothetical protein